MAQQTINIGALANDRTGDTWRAAMGKANDNFTEIYGLQGSDPVVFIAQESDFPVQDATKITLEAGKIYQYTASFTTAKYFDVKDGAKITAFNFFAPVLTYSGTGSMFVGIDASFSIRECRIDHPNSQGFSFTDTVGGQFLFLMDTVRILSGTKFGTFNNLQTVLVNSSSAIDLDQGSTFTGSANIITSFNKFFIGSTSAAFVGFDLGTAVSQNFEFTDVIAIGGVGSVGIKGSASSANVPSNVVATVSKCNFSGVTAPLDTITIDDIRWSFTSNSTIADTMQDAMVSMSSNATATVIGTISTPVLAAGTFAVDRQSFFTCTTGGRVTYNGEKPIITPVDISVSLDPSSGANRDLKVYLAKNGTVIVNSGKSVRVDTGNPLNVSVIWQLSLVQNDYLEIFVENNTNTTNIVVVDAVLRVR